MAKIGSCLTRLVAHHESLRIYQPECINDDLALYRLDGINNNSDGTRCELLEGLLSVDIDGGQPAAETRM